MVGAIVEVGGNVVVIISLVELSTVGLESGTVCVFNVVTVIEETIVGLESENVGVVVRGLVVGSVVGAVFVAGLVVDSIEDVVVEDGLVVGAIVEVGGKVVVIISLVEVSTVGLESGTVCVFNVVTVVEETIVGLESDNVGVVVGGLVVGSVVGAIVVTGLVVDAIEDAVVEDGLVVGAIVEVGGKVVVIISLVEVPTVGVESDTVCVFNVVTAVEENIVGLESDIVGV